MGTTSLSGCKGLSCLGPPGTTEPAYGAPSGVLSPGRGRLTLRGRGLQLLLSSANKVWAVRAIPRAVATVPSATQNAHGLSATPGERGRCVPAVLSCPAFSPPPLRL